MAVLIGANGSGKSNFIRFFELLSWMLGLAALGEFVALQGGADDQLFRGRRVTPLIDATVSSEPTVGGSTICLPTPGVMGDRFFFRDEVIRSFRDR